MVLLYAFGASGLLLRPRAELSEEVSVCLKAGSVLVYLHEALVAAVDFAEAPLFVGRSMFYQLDLLFEEGPKHREERLPVPRSLMEELGKMQKAMKELPVAEAPLLALKDAHLSACRGVGVAAFHAALPTLPQGAGFGACLEAALLGGLDTVTEVRAPPQSGTGERRHFGAKWDLEEYYQEEGEGFKIYSKHLSVLYRSRWAVSC